MPALQGKIAIVTGGSSGIGLATAKRFVKEGAYVFITGRRQAELDEAVAEIGSNVTAVQGDVSNLDDLDRLYKEVATKKGKLDVLFANAGIVEPKPTAAVSLEHYNKTFDVNARGVFFAVQKALPLMKDGGSIILTGSGLWQKGIPVYAAYGATKAALRSFARTWTADLSARGDCFRGGVPGFGREQLHHWNRFAGRWRLSGRISSSSTSELQHDFRATLVRRT